MKAIMRMLEAIVSSIILLTALTFFFTSQERPATEDTFLVLQTLDMLASLEKSGSLANFIRNNDTAQLNSALRNLLPPTVDFSIEINGMPPKKIFVGCNCSISDRTTLETMIEGTVMYRERSIEILVDTENLDSIREETNILFFIDYRNLTPEMDKINSFLSRGGSLAMLTDLSESQVNDSVMNNTFSLKWIGGASGTTGFFTNEAEPQKPTFRIYNYQDNITGTFADANKFQFTKFFSTGGIEVDNKTVIYDAGPTPRSLAKANTNLGSSRKGRTVWIADYDKTNPENNDTIVMNNLVKSAVLWASGESFTMDETIKTLPKKYVQARYFVSSDNVFDSFEVIVKIWRIFF